MSGVGSVTWVWQQQLEELIQGGNVYGVPWYDVLINAALDLNNDKTKMSRVEAIDAMIKHLQEHRELALRSAPKNR
jgi:hypothetical protein